MHDSFKILVENHRGTLMNVFNWDIYQRVLEMTEPLIIILSTYAQEMLSCQARFTFVAFT